MENLSNYSLSPISDEQQLIIDMVSKGTCNIKIDAVAGSGKSTTAFYIAKINPTKPILLLTYNAKLKLETREKAKALGLDNLEVHSYHAFCVKYFYAGGCKDSGILRFLKLKKEKKPTKPFMYSIIIVDEAQDMNYIYYSLVLHILKSNANPDKTQIIVMGDQKQSIYAFNKADNRYLTNAHEIFGGSIFWQDAVLSTSYRITKQMADFLNYCCRGAPHINTIKSGSKVRYLVADTYGLKPVLEIKRLLNSGYKYGDIFVLAPSVKNERSPVRNLANELTKLGINIYVPTSDDEHLDEDILRGKIVFSTFHQVKGLERKAVLVYSVDSGYFEYYDKNGSPDVIPNTLYVALTRSKEDLTIIHGDDKDFCPFIIRDKLAGVVNIEISTRFYSKVTANKKKNNSKGYNKDDDDIQSHRKRVKPLLLGVTELVKYVPVDILEECKAMLNIEKIETERLTKIDIPIKTKQEDLFEGIAEINGVSIPSYYELQTTGKMTILKHIENKIMMKMLASNFKTSNNTPVMKTTCLIQNYSSSDSDSSIEETLVYKKILNPENNSTKTLLKLATHWTCIKSGFNFKKSQIKNYEWLEKGKLEEATKRLDKILDTRITDGKKQLQFEYPLKLELDNNNDCGGQIYGFADIIANGVNLWELKTSANDDLSSEHFLQVAIYLYIATRQSLPIDNAYISIIS